MAGLITEFLGEGLAASRPATPDIPSGAIAFWWSTDTNEMSAYVEGAWEEDVFAGGAGGLADGDYGDITVSGSGTVLTIDNATITLAKQANMATASVVYRKTAGSGAPEVQTLATLKSDLGLTGTNSGDQTITLTGDVTGSGTGSFAATIGNDKVTLAKLANASANSKLLGSGSAGSGADYAEITLGTGLTMTGTTLDAAGSTTTIWDTFDPTGGAASAGAFGSRGGVVIPSVNFTVYALVFRFTADAGVTYEAQIVELDGSNNITSIVATKQIGTGLTTAAYYYHVFTFASPVTVTAGTRYGFMCTRNTTSGSTAWSMRGSGAAGQIMNAGFTVVDTYLRATLNTLAVSSALSSGSNAYWFGVRVTPV